MTPMTHTQWSQLGSNLWLRIVSPADLTRLDAFLTRRDLVRSQGADLKNLSRLLPWDSDPTETPRGLAMIATDVMGAPAGFFAVHSGLGDGPPEVSFAIPKDEPAHLHEGLRLLADGLAANTTLQSLLLRVEPGDLEDVLEQAGWQASGTGTWLCGLHGDASLEVNRAD